MTKLATVSTLDTRSTSEVVAPRPAGDPENAAAYWERIQALRAELAELRGRR